ncbi:MAG: uroporphyrinogen decarboxylase family protein [Actinobacteria bacterium]|nr:uroporphyrinogen decarboxylase family protein [Actinomycetota bacterium]
MAKHKIKIKYSNERIKQNKKRLEAAFDFKPLDRTPVLFGTFERYYLKARNVTYEELYSDSDSMLHQMILNQAWAIENIPDDRCVDNVITIPGPWFDNTLESSAFGAEVAFYRNEPPRVKHLNLTLREAADLEVPDPLSGLYAKKKKYFFEWQEKLKDYSVTFNDEPGRIEIGIQEIGGGSPILQAVELFGTDFYEWLHKAPEACHSIFEKITTFLVNKGLYWRKLDPRTPSIYLLADDFAETISLDMYRKFLVPYNNQIFEVMGKSIRDGRSLHNCGNSTHLLDAFVNDLKISSFWLFGYQVDPYLVAEKMAKNKIFSWGNLNCMALLHGPVEKIYEESINCIKAFAPYGGFYLGDGANVAPDTPVEHLQQVMKAALDFGEIPKR